ncbi:MAG: SDR family oxidoreductase [Bacteroidota bacterium]|nr:SDR family oxidoreductase [Bacteroidota bacterium]
MILITGATGNFGKATIDFLLKKGIAAGNISALVRDEAKAADLKAKGITLKLGDYDNYGSLVEAFKGVDKLLLVSGTDMLNRGKQHVNVVNAAKEAGVKHILYTSIERKNETETSPMAIITQPHLDSENAIKASGMKYTILKENLWLDVLPMFFGDKVLETGIFLPAGEAKSAFALRSDMAEATANILASEGHEDIEYTFANSENISMEEVAEILSDVSGKTVGYTNPNKDIYIVTITKAGVPKEYVGMFSFFAEAIKQGEFTCSKTDLENLLGRKPVKVKDFFKQAYASKN